MQNKNMKKGIPIALIIISILGVLVSVYALSLHNKDVGETFCNINETFNCDVVNKGEYSEVAGIPVAIMGIIGYVVLIAGALLAMNHTKIWEYVMMAAGLGLVFALYLTYLEAFVINAWCIVCLASQLLILLAFILSIIQFKYVRNNISGSRTMGEGIPKK